MSRSASPLSAPDIQAAAAAWIARRNGKLSPADEAALRRWLTADPRHVAAYAEAEQAWALLNSPRITGDTFGVRAEIAARAARRERRRWRVISGTLAAAAAVVVFAFVLRSGPNVAQSASLPNAPTVVVRPDLRNLSDGSAIELNSGADVEVAFTAERRLVHLRRGEALFRVAKDVTRPFIVEANGIEVRAVGTAFNVRLAESGVEVIVTEGQVHVARGPESLVTELDFAKDAERPPLITPVSLGAGERTLVSFTPEVTSQVALVSQEQLAQALAWRGRRVEFTGTPLAEAVELFNQQNGTKLSVGDSASAELEITGIFWADDPDGFVRLLESGELVRATRTSDGVVLRSIR